MSRGSIHVLRFLMLCLCSSFLLSMAFSPKTFAASNPITITYQADSVHFPNYIDFTATANDSAAPITYAFLFITFKDTPDAIEEQRNVPVHSGKNITLRWREDTSNGNSFHSPGTPVEYYWELQDSSNDQYIAPVRDFTTIDTRFSWQHLSHGFLQVNWYNRPQDFGQLVLSKANSSITNINLVLGGGLLHPINLWIYSSALDFHGALAPNSYEWVGGEAHPYLNEAFISVTDSEDLTLIRDMPHELTHLVFHQLIAQGPLAPTWFDEGLAVFNQSYHEPEMNYRFNQALGNHTLLRLYEITDGFPADADRAYLAYAQSWNLVGYMYSTFGQSKMTLLIKKMNNPQTGFGEDLTQALGEDEVHLENQWRLHLNQSAILSPNQVTPTAAPSIQIHQSQSMLTDSTAPLFITLGALLILLPIAGIVAIFVYQRRRQQQVPAIQAAQHMPIANAPPGLPMNPIQYTNAPRNMPQTSNPATPQQYMPFPYSGPTFEGPPPNGLFAPSQTPLPPLNTPDSTWQFDYPATVEEKGANKGTVTFGPFQENLNAQPRKNAPQE